MFFNIRSSFYFQFLRLIFISNLLLLMLELKLEHEIHGELTTHEEVWSICTLLLRFLVYRPMSRRSESHCHLVMLVIAIAVIKSEKLCWFKKLLLFALPVRSAKFSVSSPTHFALADVVV